jgi:hypothetical protein
MTYNHHDILLTFVAYGLKNFSEVSNMRKVLSVLLLASLLFGIGTNAFATENTKVETVKTLIINTNIKIENEIAKAVEKADKLRADYLSDVRKLEEEGKVALIEKEYLIGLEEEQAEEETMEVVEERLFIIEDIMFSEKNNSEEKLLLVENEVNEITTLLFSNENMLALNSLEQEKQSEGKTVYEKYIQLTDKYIKQLKTIIENLQEKAEKLSTNTIKKATEVGINAVCELVLVRIGHEYVWVDPIRVVGLN